MKLKQYACAALLLLAACNTNEQNGNASEPKKSLQALKWMLGNWQNTVKEGTLSENWQVESDSLWAGEGKMTDTTGEILFSEHLQLVLRADTIWYIPTVANQNNGQPVRFMQTVMTDTSVVFENLKHDFPQRIVYHKTSDSMLSAYIEGLQDGKMRKEEFSYKKAD